jgi:dsRNA-specific ribonuclease
MIVKVSFSGYVDTNRQDKFLRDSIEHYVTGLYTDTEEELITRTFKSRFDSRFLQVEQCDKKDPSFRLIDTLNPF